MADGDLTTTRTARCACGTLTAQTIGDPEFVVACHCLECQRRTGSVFGVGAYYPTAKVTIAGTFNVYVRDGQAGRKLRFRFCPTCGTTVFWDVDLRPGYMGVAVGAMGDPGFPPPTRSVWEQSRHPWVACGHDVPRFDQQALVATDRKPQA